MKIAPTKSHEMKCAIDTFNANGLKLTRHEQCDGPVVVQQKAISSV